VRWVSHCSGAWDLLRAGETCGHSRTQARDPRGSGSHRGRALQSARTRVETAHQLLDVAFCEDKPPWITSNPSGALVVAILRRIAYTMLTLYRSVIQRSDARRDVPWRTLLGEVFLAFVTLSNEQLAPRSRLALTPD